MKSRAVIVGTSQIRKNPKYDGPFVPHEPADLMAEAIAAALGDVHARGGEAPDVLQTRTSLLAVVDPLAWGYHDLVGTVAAKASISSDYEPMTVPPGGNSPGDLLNLIVNQIVAGHADVAILVGAESVFSRRRAAKESIALDWTPFDGHRDFMKGQRPLTNEIETRHGLTAPIHCYPLYENALRAKSGRTVAEHQRFLGSFMARNTSVAAQNPYAWFPVARSADEISTPSQTNRMVCFPYPKLMNSIMEVDLAAAIVVMSAAEAQRQGIAEQHQVTILGGAGATDGWCPTERSDFTSSPAIAAASSAALECAGLRIDEIELFDIYSCFPSAVQMALHEINVAPDDPRGVTVTGGLAYAGGPGNNYSLHGLATMVERLRDPDDSRTTGLVSALGNTATKHAMCVLSTDPGKIADAQCNTLPKVAVTFDAPTLVDERCGPATVETYTVVYDRSGLAASTVFVTRFEDGTRTVALGECTEREVGEITTNEAIGRQGFVTGGDAASNVPNRFALDGQQ